jgi:hypothetical protein
MSNTANIGTMNTDLQVPAGGPEAGAGGVTGVDNISATGQPDQRADQPKGKPGPDTAGGSRTPNGGLAQVFAGQPDAGPGGVTGADNIGAAGQPDQRADQPRGNPGPNQSNDNLSLPKWTEQISRKYAVDPNSMEKLQALGSLDDLVQAYLDASTGNGRQLSLPGESSTPEEIQAFYEQLGKPKEAGGYKFAKSDPALARAAFDANLTCAQADALHSASLAQLDVLRKNIDTANARDFQAADALLQEEYGHKYNEAIVLMQRGLGNNPKTGEPSPIAKALVDAGLAGKPEIVRAFIELGRATSEGSAPGGGGMSAPMPESVTQGRGFSYKDEY